MNNFVSWWWALSNQTTVHISLKFYNKIQSIDNNQILVGIFYFYIKVHVCINLIETESNGFFFNSMYALGSYDMVGAWEVFLLMFEFSNKALVKFNKLFC